LGIIFIISLVKFRASKQPKADPEGVKSHISSVLEVVVAIIEMIILVVLRFLFWANRG